MNYGFLLIFLTITQLLFAQKFTLNGKAKDIADGFIYLNYQDAEGKPVRDSSTVNGQGEFSFSGNIDGPTMIYLSYGKVRSVDDVNTVNFFIAPARMTTLLTRDKFKDAVVRGSKVQEAYRQLNEKKKEIYSQLSSLSAQYRNEKDKDKAQQIRDKMEPYNRQLDTIDYKFFSSHPGSYVTAYMLRFHVADFSWEQLEGYYDHFGPNVRKSKYGQYVKEEFEKLRGGSPGAMAKDFSRNDINGSPLSLFAFRDKKIVLLDFWASWCVPCRKGNPHMKELYSKYKDKGLEIIGVSDDDSRPENWKKAVQQDSLPWLHVLRGLDWDKLRKGEKSENDISEKFGIHELPTRILVDKNGLIIGRYGEEDEELDKKLREIFGE